MLKQALQKARNVLYVKILSEKEGGELRKTHSTLHTYKQGDDTIEFVANFGTPAVGGFIVQIEADAPVYLTKQEFDRQYLEAAEQQVAHIGATNLR